MIKNILFYLLGFLLLLSTCIFFTHAYRCMVKYESLSNENNAGYIHFQQLSDQIRNAAVINPALTSISDTNTATIFYFDSALVNRSLQQLKANMADSLNRSLLVELEAHIRQQLPWIIASNVPDSLAKHKGEAHLLVLNRINSLIKQGLVRTNASLLYNKQQLSRASLAMRMQMLLFTTIAIALLCYTVIAYSRIRNKHEKRFSAIIDQRNAFFMLLDKNWKNIYSNGSVDRLATWLPGQQKTGKLPLKPHPEDLADFEQVMANAINKPAAIFTFKARVLHAKGHYAWMEGTVQNLLADTSVHAVVINGCDITPRMQADEALAKSQSHYRMLFEQATDAIYLIDSTMLFTDINPAGCHLLGYSKEELLAIKPANLVFKEDLRAFRTGISALKRGEMVVYKRRIKRKDGTGVDVEANAAVQADGQVMVVVRDTTDRKKLEAQQTLLASIVNSSNDAIITKSLKGIITSWNNGAEIIFGYRAEEITGRHISTLIPPHLLEEEEIILNKLKHGEKIEHYQTERRKKDGGIIYVSLTISPLRNSLGTVTGVSKIARDITGQKAAGEKLARSEQLYRTIASSIPRSVICLLDTDLRYYLIEGDILEKLGFLKDQLLGKTMRDVLDPEIFKTVETQMRRVLNGESVTRESRYNGIDIMSRFIPLKDEQHKVYSIMTVAIEITEVKDAQRKILELNESLEQKVAERTAQLHDVNDELRQFAYIASHDLQQPLRTISNYIEVFEDEYKDSLDAKAFKYLGTVKKAAARMSQLIRSLLEFSMLSQRKTLSYTDCGSLLNDVLADLETMIRSSNAVVEVSSMPQLNVYEVEMRQLFQNLLINAIKFQLPGNRPRIKISAAFLNNKWQFSVADNGIGIDADHFERVFEIFQRLHGRAAYEGSGIGLANCKKIVQLHHGDIWVTSQVGLGATFYFTIPILKT